MRKIGLVLLCIFLIITLSGCASLICDLDDTKNVTALILIDGLTIEEVDVSNYSVGTTLIHVWATDGREFISGPNNIVIISEPIPED